MLILAGAVSRAQETLSCLQEMCAHEAAEGGPGDGMQGQGQSCFEEVLGEDVHAVELMRVCLQGAYGVVRLAYNESEDRHYVSLGAEGGIGMLGLRHLRSRAQLVARATLKGESALSLCKGNELPDPWRCKQRSVSSVRRDPERLNLPLSSYPETHLGHTFSGNGRCHFSSDISLPVSLGNESSFQKEVTEAVWLSTYVLFCPVPGSS